MGRTGVIHRYLTQRYRIDKLPKNHLSVLNSKSKKITPNWISAILRENGTVIAGTTIRRIAKILIKMLIEEELKNA